MADDDCDDCGELLDDGWDLCASATLQAMAIVRAVADEKAFYISGRAHVGAYCAFCDGTVDDEPLKGKHGPDCVVTQARALLASADERSGGDGG